ncbi:MAG: hypothetical protein ACK41Y_16530 [Paracoccus hibiscisoli]|uniref:hypothetical protein n=1 Tax=Paracoccus hibiscisoli TaxID=2023261 RepID=UPI00391A3711
MHRGSCAHGPSSARLCGAQADSCNRCAAALTACALLLLLLLLLLQEWRAGFSLEQQRATISDALAHNDGLLRQYRQLGGCLSAAGHCC